MGVKGEAGKADLCVSVPLFDCPSGTVSCPSAHLLHVPALTCCFDTYSENSVIGLPVTVTLGLSGEVIFKR